MASGPITSWQIGGNNETMKTVTDFIIVIFFLAPESLQMVTAAMKLRVLLLGKKAVTNLDSILKSRDITLPVWGHLCQQRSIKSKLWFFQ